MEAAARCWEEDGFAWPPRSFFCNFCGRKLRSAQALGGHMNIHRRDRAKLKHSHASESNFVDPYQNHRHYHHYHQDSSCKIIDLGKPYTLIYKPKTRVSVSPPVYGISNPSSESNCLKPNKENDTSKRRRKHELLLPLPPNSSTSKKDHVHEPEVKGLCQGAKQELDLELRLGNSLF